MQGSSDYTREEAISGFRGSCAAAQKAGEPLSRRPDRESRLRRLGAAYHRLDDQQLFDCVAEELAEGKVVGWLQGRMEFGPRSLGGRSILGDARNTKMQSVMNLKIKYRESFRPFAPTVLQEKVSEYFQIDHASPYMLLVAPVTENRRIAMTLEQEKLFGIDKLNIARSEIPAVTHVDYSARIQTVHASTNPLFHRLLKHFKEKTGCPVLVNTSFNVRGEPIVCTPEDAFRCFMGNELDLLVVGNCFLDKASRPRASSAYCGPFLFTTPTAARCSRCSKASNTTASTCLASVSSSSFSGVSTAASSSFI